ncbi:MAG: peptidoglycan bridge formation glycyltransferase FemA/FemB family protein, partial [Erysipelotrichaceae bacterium]
LPLVDKTYEQVWKAYKPRTRNRINAAKNFGSKVREGGIADLPEFYDILTHTSERNEFASRNIGYFQAFLEETLEQGLSKLLFVDVDLAAVETSLIKERTQAETRLAKALTRTDTAGVIKDLEGKIASANKSLEELVVTREAYGNHIVSAASIFITYGKEVLYFHSGGYEDLMRFAGQYFLQDYMIQTAMQQGYETYNFLGIQAVDDSDGVYTFKRGFSGEAIAYLGQFDLIVAPKVYGLYQVLRKLKNRG